MFVEGEFMKLEGVRNLSLLGFAFLGVGVLSGCGSSTAASTTKVTDMGALASGLMPKVSAATAALYSTHSMLHPLANYTGADESTLNGDEGFEILKLLGDPTLAGSDGGWGIENIRNNLSQSRALADAMGGATTAATTVSTVIESNAVTLTVPAKQSYAKAIPALPFTFDLSAPTFSYDNAIGDSASTLVMGDVSVPIGLYSVWSVGTAFTAYSVVTFPDESNVFDGSYNGTTGDLKLSKAGRTSESFRVRMELTGNTTTSDFSLRYARLSGTSGRLAVSAKGNTAGATNFYALKVKTCNGVDCLASTTTHWYCISAATDYSDFQTFIGTIADHTDSADVAGKIEHVTSDSHAGFTGDCATYATALDSADYAFFGETDVPDEAGPYAGTLGIE